MTMPLFEPRRARARVHERESDETLVARAKAGEQEAFEELVRRHAEHLYSVVRHLCRSSEEAEDVTQETFLRAWRSIGAFRGSAAFFTWLYRIGVNEAKRRLSRQPTPLAAALDDGSTPEPPDVREAPFERAAHRELRATLERAVRELPFKYRAPLILRDIEGLSNAEAASVLSLNEGAFKSRLHRARSAVRKAIEEHEGGEP
jgi:RNA polymerase sigma-70 factor (ECF subfamily)